VIAWQVQTQERGLEVGSAIFTVCREAAVVAIMRIGISLEDAEYLGWARRGRISKVSIRDKDFFDS
jgi:hypothetical protein